MQKLLGPTWVEINLDSIAQNTKNIKKLIGKKIELMAITKGNAYGHDISEVAQIFLENGASKLAVARAEEGIFLRKTGINVPILVLGLTLEAQAELLLLYDITPSVCEIKFIKKISKLAIKMNKLAKVHLKVDTGMGRIGVLPQDVLNFIKRVISIGNIEIEGIFTHFSVADEEDKAFTENQFNKFIEIINILKKEKIKIPLKHTSNSAALLDLPNMWMDMVRPGICLYGLYPSEEVKKTIRLIPAQEFKTRIVFIKELPAEKSISYGRTYTTFKEKTVIATLPVGYADGYSRLLSNKGEVLLRGKRVPIIGRICMDQCMIDVTNIPQVKIGDEVVLWGKQGDEKITVEEIAKKIGTINYEVVHMPDKARVPKLFIKNGKPYKIKNMFGERLL
ncbi:MAG: alanine racemase [Candidatus Caldatribacteriota bacterium]|nr:alanine racemase [Candidatus Caldatribacteriota bacterium]